MFAGVPGVRIGVSRGSAKMAFFQCGLFKQEPIMTANFLEYIALLALLASNPVSLSYMGLAMVHLIAMHCYLKHRDGHALACCAGLASALYLFLACLHGLAHS
jgi:hypothetical protein